LVDGEITANESAIKEKRIRSHFFAWIGFSAVVTTLI